MKICEYGCGQEAKYQFKNGKWCCSENFSFCPETRKKISESMIGKNKGKILGPQSEEHKKKNSEAKKGIPQSKKHIRKRKLTIDKIKEKYPIFSKTEEMRENENGDIQVRCKNHNCKNSKEKGGWFTPSYYTFKNRIWAVEKPDGNDGSYLYCCQHCKDTCPLYRLKSDPLIENNLPYTLAEDIEAKRRALKRDNELCQDCGKPGIEVHHIKPVKLEPFLALDIDNLITLCEDCHKKYHKKGDENSTGNLANITCSPESQKFLDEK